ncbi:MAG: homoserine O-acetyltransferase [Bacteroidetes bacterium]|nr:MAG: homoserine O-acetyltransferase [Bacteroidota bacterium]
MDLKQVFVTPFALESGIELPRLEMHYSVYGDLNSGKPIVWVIHALTADANVAEWWEGLVGENGFFNAEEYTIVCANNIGSCYGSTGPESFNPRSEKAYLKDFPRITTRDMSRAIVRLADSLGIERIDYLIGASMGGQIALEWAIRQPRRMTNLILLATNAQHSPWGIAFNEAQRMALATDPEFDAGGAARSGLKAARAVAMLSYRTYQCYGEKQSDDLSLGEFGKAARYQQYQGEKLANRFSAYAYWTLSHAMDTHNVGRGRVSVEDALGAIRACTLVIGIEEDLLFPIAEQRFLAKAIPGARFRAINSLYGHDGFLIETDAITALLEEFVSLKEPCLHD